MIAAGMSGINWRCCSHFASSRYDILIPWKQLVQFSMCVLFVKYIWLSSYICAYAESTAEYQKYAFCCCVVVWIIPDMDSPFLVIPWVGLHTTFYYVLIWKILDCCHSGPARLSQESHRGCSWATKTSNHWWKVPGIGGQAHLRFLSTLLPTPFSDVSPATYFSAKARHSGM